MALQPPAECSQWIDSTAYGQQGVLVSDWGPGPIYTSRPLVGQAIKALVGNLTCMPPGPMNGTAMVGHVQLTGFTSITGQYQHMCRDPQNYITVIPVSSRLDQSCSLVREHIQQAWASLVLAQSLAGNLQDPPELWGMQCLTYPKYSIAVMQFRWSLSSNLPFTVKLVIQCLSGDMSSLMTSLKQFGITSLPPDVVSTIYSSQPSFQVCLRPILNNTACVLLLLKASACGTFPFFAVAAAGQIDCINAPKYYSGPCSDKLQKHYDCCGGYAYGELPELAVDLSAIAQLALLTLTPDFCDVIQLVGQCPGSIYPFSDILPFFQNAMVFLDDALQAYDQQTVFAFTCIISTPPTLQTRFSYILPYCNIVHTVALTYLVRYVYKMLKLTETLGAKRAKDAAGAEEAPKVEPPLPEATTNHLSVLEEVYPALHQPPGAARTPRVRAEVAAPL